MKHVHFVGIGGAGQRAVAELLMDRGVSVSGSDVQPSPGLDELRQSGARVALGHAAQNVGEADLVVVSSAVPAANPEIVAARARGIPVIKNAEMLARLAAGKRLLAVAGTHGKTTTTSMLGWTLVQAGLDPDLIVGGEVRNLGRSGRGGQGAFFVVEADEYDRRFHQLSPEVAIVTNVEIDHLDYYGSEAAMREAFVHFAARLPDDGLLILCHDDPGCRALGTTHAGPIAWYGIEPTDLLDWSAHDLQLDRWSSRFVAARQGERVAEIELGVPGRHNVINAVAVLAAADRVGVPIEVLRDSLRTFRGARRRLELLGEYAGVELVIDYAHLPAELRATISAARNGRTGRIWACFQPHTYARTELLMDDFTAAFDDAERVVIVGMYVPPGREVPHGDAAARTLAERIRTRRGDGQYVASVAALPPLLRAQTRPGDLVLLLGAGDIVDAGPPLLHQGE